MEKTVVIDKVAFENLAAPDRGFTVRASYLTEPKGEALVEISREGEPYRRFLYPAYKVFNIAAHFSEIVTSEIEGDNHGYDLAGWAGFNVIHPRSLEAE